MNTDTMLENVTLPIEFLFDEKHQQILIALHHLGTIGINELRIVSHLLSSSEHDYVKLLKQIIADGAYGAIENYLGYDREKFSKLLKGATNFNELPEIDEEIKYLNDIGLIEKSTSIKTVKYGGKTKELISTDERFTPSWNYGDNNCTFINSDKFDSVKTKKFSEQLIRLTAKGKQVAQRVAEGRRIVFRPIQSERITIFIACAFGYEEINQLYDIHFKPACEKFCYVPFRVDLNEPAQSITKSILDGITEAECVIADLTFARPSVYFEVGLAHGLGIPLVLTCRKDHLNGTEDDKKVHFDLAQYKISYWSVTEQGEFEWEEGMSPTERLKLVLKGEGKS